MRKKTASSAVMDSENTTAGARTPSKRQITVNNDNSNDKQKHTPGPLRAIKRRFEATICLPEGGEIALLGDEVCPIETTDDTARMHAYADLFAAAPELLEALEALIKDIDNGRMLTANRTEKARAAIAKALGK